jgi:predicted dehydrogenase
MEPIKQNTSKQMVYNERKNHLGGFMDKKVRWGLVSTARINQKVMPSIKRSDRGELTAVASRDLKKAKKYARKNNIPHYYGSYEELLASPEIDAVYISLPHHLHKEWSIKALNAGKHVLCEKPFALTVEDVDEMFAAATANNKILQEAFMYLHHPQMKILSDLLAEKVIGDVQLVRAFFSFRLDNFNDIRMVPEYGGGSIWDIGVYPISFAQFVFGEPPEAITAAKISDIENSIDLSLFATLEYSSDRMAQIGSSFSTPYYTAAEIFGTNGHIILPSPFNNLEKVRRIEWVDAKDKKHTIRVPKKPLYDGEIENMHDAILNSKPALVTHEQTRNHIKTVLEILEAAKEK